MKRMSIPLVRQNENKPANISIYVKENVNVFFNTYNKPNFRLIFGP